MTELEFVDKLPGRGGRSPTLDRSWLTELQKHPADAANPDDGWAIVERTEGARRAGRIAAKHREWAERNGVLRLEVVARGKNVYARWLHA